MNSLSVGLPFFLILVMFRLRACFYLLLMHLYCSLSLSHIFLGSLGFWKEWPNRCEAFFRGVCKPMQVGKFASIICHGPCSNRDQSRPWKCLCLFTPCGHLPVELVPTAEWGMEARHFSSYTATLLQWQSALRSQYFYFFFSWKCHNVPCAGGRKWGQTTVQKQNNVVCATSAWIFIFYCAVDTGTW